MDWDIPMTKHIVSVSMDQDDLGRIEIVKQLYNIPTRSEAIRVAIKLLIDMKLKDQKG